MGVMSTAEWAAHMRAQMCIPDPQPEEFVMALFPETHRTQLVERHEIVTEFDSLMTLAWREAVWARGEILAQEWADQQGVGIEVERFTSFGPGDADDPSASCGLIGVRWSVTIGRQPDEAQQWVWSARWFDWAARFMAMRAPDQLSDDRIRIVDQVVDADVYCGSQSTTTGHVCNLIDGHVARHTSIDGEVW